MDGSRRGTGFFAGGRAMVIGNGDTNVVLAVLRRAAPLPDEVVEPLRAALFDLILPDRRTARVIAFLDDIKTQVRDSKVFDFDDQTVALLKRAHEMNFRLNPVLNSHNVCGCGGDPACKVAAVNIYRLDGDDFKEIVTNIAVRDGIGTYAPIKGLFQALSKMLLLSTLRDLFPLPARTPAVGSLLRKVGLKTEDSISIDLSMIDLLKTAEDRGFYLTYIPDSAINIHAPDGSKIKTIAVNDETEISKSIKSLVETLRDEVVDIAPARAVAGAGR